MPEVKASPQNPLLGLLAQALYKARDVMSPAQGSWADRKGFNIADFVIGDAPEEVENWSYGNKPFAVPEMSRIPQGKTTVVERNGKKERKSRAGMALDASAFTPLGAVDSLAGGAMKGAVRLGGDPRAVALHTTPTRELDKIRSIRDRGLYAPSIGLTADRRGDYQGHNPTLVWRAGELDRQFPDSAPPGIFNRDAYVWNPSRASPNSILDQYKNYFESTMASGDSPDVWSLKLAKALGDERLTQMAPDHGSQTASIMASPSFRSLAEWETSPQGMGALTTLGGGEFKTIENYNYVFNEIAQRHGLKNPYGGVDDKAMKQLLEQFPHLAKSGLNPDMLRGSPLGDLFDTARKAPSEMGEMKIYAPSVPASPNEASVFMPRGNDGEANNWRDAGYQVYSPDQVYGLAGRLPDLDDSWKAQKNVPLQYLAPPSGAAPPSPAEAQRMFDDMRTKGSSMLGAPGLPSAAPANDMDQLVWKAEESWKPPAQQTIPMAKQIEDEYMMWFKGEPGGSLAEQLTASFDLSNLQKSELQALWDKADTGEGAAKDMQAKILEWKGAVPGKTIDLDKELLEGLPEPGPGWNDWVAQDDALPPGIIGGSEEADMFKEQLADIAENFGVDPGTAKKLYSDFLNQSENFDVATYGEEWLAKNAPKPIKPAAGNNFGFPAGHPAIKIFTNPTSATITELGKALDVPADMLISQKFKAISQKLGLTSEETTAAMREWLNGAPSGMSTGPEVFLKYLK